MIYQVCLFFALVAFASANLADFNFAYYKELSKVHPVLADFALKAVVDPEAVAKEIASSPAATIVDVVQQPTTRAAANASAPIVFMHGMGDSCFNQGMQSITQAAGTHMGVYSVCIPTGSTQSSDTNNGFFMTMDKNVDVFAAAVAADPKLANGFNAIGFSQGNSVIRGYIQRYNNPKVFNYISVHGTVMGVASFPKCDTTGLLGPVCNILASIAGDLAYNSFIQGLLFQANYLRDPKLLTNANYLKYSELANWNNEPGANATYNTNFDSIESWYMIRAMKDTMIHPSIGEWWGQFTPGQMTTEQNMTETNLYQNDMFGLKTADKAGKISFNHTDGDHLQFTIDQLYYWMGQRFV